ncbi:MAG: hypothetical protein J0L97_03345 [Alphaproteobacteria bacterium]|nr:hypothetical protein [Alphaproteobacteria bacterium]
MVNSVSGSSPYSYLDVLQSPSPKSSVTESAPTLGEILDSISISPAAQLAQGLYPADNAAFNPITALLGGDSGGGTDALSLFGGGGSSGPKISPVLQTVYASLFAKANLPAPEKITAPAVTQPLQTVLDKYHAVLNTDYSKPLPSTAA